MTYVNDPFASVRKQAAELVAQMTLEERAAFCAGADYWHTYPIERLGIPSVMVTDGPNGLRKQITASDHMGLNESVPATCFPTAAATACSFDPALTAEMGAALGEECLAEDVAVLLGPAANIKRSPLCGRNFEYFSEDPLLTGLVAAGMIRGIQSKNVGTSMKHYLANNQEKARLVSDSVVDHRALREIYLPAFEIAIKEAQPWTLMCSYNMIDGTYASDNKQFMTDIPRGEWDYQGTIVTDWGAMNDRVQSIQAGLDLEMPGPCDENRRIIIDAVNSGALREQDLDLCATRIAALVLQASKNKTVSYDVAAHHTLAGRIAAQSAVLLKNNGKTLPVSKEAKIAVVGAYSKTARYQGAGSGKVHPHHVTSLCDALDERGIHYTYAPGYEVEAASPDETLIREAVASVQGADVILVCAALPDSFESEGFDRSHMNMPDAQNALIDALTATGIPVVVILSTGSAVILPWREKVDSILLMYLAGQNGGSAAADLIFGDVNPCGKLAETWPLALEDNPSYLHFGHGHRVEYRESIYVGYRYYDKAGLDVQYPFGHGLSYTDYTYSNLKLSKTEMTDGDTLEVELTVTNTGDIAGQEIVQIYVAPPEGKAFRPVRELRAFSKVVLAAGESKKVCFTLDKRAFAYYNTAISDWYVPDGSYRIEAAASSRDIRLSAEVSFYGAPAVVETDFRASAFAYYTLKGSPLDIPQKQFETVLGHPVAPWRPVRPYTRNTTFSELMTCQLGRQILQDIVGNMQQEPSDSHDDIDALMESMMDDLPVRQIALAASLIGSKAPDMSVEQLVAQLNAQPEE